MDVNTILSDIDHISVLEKACRLGFFEVAKYLIENGAEVNTKSSGDSGYVQKTPLQHAVFTGHDKLTLLLLEKGADVNTKDSYENSVLHIAIDQLNRNKNIKHVLNRDKEIKHVPEQAEESNPKEVIRQILSKDVKVNESGRNGKTPLSMACEIGSLEIIQWIVDKGADVNAFGKYGRPPLFAAISQGNVEIVRYLFEKGAKPNLEEPEWIRDCTNFFLPNTFKTWPTPFTSAVSYHFLKKSWRPNPEMLRLLHKYQADINKLGQDRKNPLHYAAESGDLDTVKLLIELGADPSIKTSIGKSAAEIARVSDHPLIANYLEGL